MHEDITKWRDDVGERYKSVKWRDGATAEHYIIEGWCTRRTCSHCVRGV